MNNINKSIKEIKEIKDKVEALSNRVKKLEKGVVDIDIIDNADFIQLMKISNSTARNWRNKGLIPYTQIENKIYYNLSDIKKMIDNNTSP